MTKRFDSFDLLIRESQRRVAENFEDADPKDVTLAGFGWLADRLEATYRGNHRSRGKAIISFTVPLSSVGFGGAIVLLAERLFS